MKHSIPWLPQDIYFPHISFLIIDILLNTFFIFLYVKQADSNARDLMNNLWESSLRVKWGPFFRLRSAAKNFGIIRRKFK